MRRDELEQGGTERDDEFLCVPGELVVHADDSDAVNEALGGLRGASLRRVGAFEVWSLPEGTRTTEVIGRARGTSAARVAASPHYVFGACVARAPMAAFPPMATSGRLPPVEAEGAALTVGVLDTGIVLQDDRATGKPHPWLAGRVRFIDSDTDAKAADDASGLLPHLVGHGTMVAGVVLGEAPLAGVRALRTMADGFGSDEDVAAAIRELVADGVRLLNLSFGGNVMTETEAPPLIADALRGLPDDVVVVAAAGNFGGTRRVWPAASGRVIAVGAVEDLPHPSPAPFTGRGSWVDAYAPGVSVVGPFCFHRESGSPGNACRPAQHFDGWARGTGTSLAAAVVTGRIAQLAIASGIGVADAADRLLQDAPRITVGTLERPFVASTATILPASD